MNFPLNELYRPCPSCEQADGIHVCSLAGSGLHNSGYPHITYLFIAACEHCGEPVYQGLWGDFLHVLISLTSLGVGGWAFALFLNSLSNMPLGFWLKWSAVTLGAFVVTGLVNLLLRFLQALYLPILVCEKDEPRLAEPHDWIWHSLTGLGGVIFLGLFFFPLFNKIGN